MLCRFVKALCPQQAIDAYTPDAWHEVLGHLDLAECKQAVIAAARRGPFIAPAEIIAAVATSRAASRPHSNACRDRNCRDCHVSWCCCTCHPEAVGRLTGPNPPEPYKPPPAVQVIEPGPRRFDPAKLTIGRVVPP